MTKRRYNKGGMSGAKRPCVTTELLYHGLTDIPVPHCLRWTGHPASCRRSRGFGWRFGPRLVLSSLFVVRIEMKMISKSDSGAFKQHFVQLHGSACTVVSHIPSGLVRGFQHASSALRLNQNARTAQRDLPQQALLIMIRW